MYDSENSISVGDYDMSKELRLKIRDLKNKITGKDKVIEEYNKATMEIATLSDKEKDPEVKKKLLDLYQQVTDEKWEKTGKSSMTVSDYNPYKGSKKKTRKKIEMAKVGLKKIKGGR